MTNPTPTLPAVIDANVVVIPANTDQSQLRLLPADAVPGATATGDATAPTPAAAPATPYELQHKTHIDDDYAFARQNLYEVMKKATKALEELANIATASQALRAYEAMAPMIKAVAEANEKLLILQNNRQALEDQESQQESSSPGHITATGNNVIFVGTTAELLEKHRQALQQSTPLNTGIV